MTNTKTPAIVSKVTIEETQQEFMVLGKCPTCEGNGVVIINAGCCGGCDICGSAEEKEVSCPDCSLYLDEDSQDREE